jgi:polyphenol oxidase
VPTSPAPLPNAAGPFLGRAGGLEVLRWPVLDALGVDAVVTTRHGGVSGGPYRSLNLGLHVGDDPDAVLENRRRAAATLGAGLSDLVFGMQVHGAGAAVVGAVDAGRGAHDAEEAVPGTDALVTNDPAPVLVTLVADCSPVVLVDPGAGVLATVHAGWRGAVANVVGVALETMVGLGARPSRTVAAIGPTVAPDVYEVGPEVARAVTGALPDGAGQVLTASHGRWHLDVAGANHLLLLAAGVPPSQVHRSPWATDDPRFFSDRAARPCGRFGLLARLRPRPSGR